MPRFDYGPQSYVWPVRLAETKSVAVELIPAKFLEVSVSLFRGWLVSKNPRNTPLEYSRTHLGWPNTPRGKLGFVLSYIRRGFRPVRQSSLLRVDESSLRESTTSSNVRALLGHVIVLPRTRLSREIWILLPPRIPRRSLSENRGQNIEFYRK